MLSLEESLKILKETKALIEGHFILSSGLHSPKYVQCAQLMSKPSKAAQICQSLAKKIKIEHGLEVGTVINSTSDENNELCNQLISISGITTIFVGPEFLTLTKKEDHDWDSINHAILTQFDKI